jgi:hypothetical protein
MARSFFGHGVEGGVVEVRDPGHRPGHVYVLGAGGLEGDARRIVQLRAACQAHGVGRVLEYHQVIGEALDLADVLLVQALDGCMVCGVVAVFCRHGDTSTMSA